MSAQRGFGWVQTTTTPPRARRRGIGWVVPPSERVRHTRKTTAKSELISAVSVPPSHRPWGQAYRPRRTAAPGPLSDRT